MSTLTREARAWDSTAEDALTALVNAAHEMDDDLANRSHPGAWRDHLEIHSAREHFRKATIELIAARDSLAAYATRYPTGVAS